MTVMMCHCIIPRLLLEPSHKDASRSVHLRSFLLSVNMEAGFATTTRTTSAVVNVAVVLQNNTILAMDFMDNGNLWDALPRVTKDGRHIFQWQNRGRKVAYEIALGLHFLHDLR